MRWSGKRCGGRCEGHLLVAVLDLQLSQVIVLCPEPAHPDKQDQSLPLTGNLCSGRKFSAPSLLKSDPWEVLLATPTSLLRSTPFCCLMRKALGNAVFPTWLCFQGCPSSLVQCIRLAHWGDGSQPGGWGAPLCRWVFHGEPRWEPSLSAWRRSCQSRWCQDWKASLGCHPRLSARPGFHPALESLDLCPFPAALSGVTN